MNLFVWEYVSKLTDNYHDGGGCVVIAETLEAARLTLPLDCSAQKESPSFTCQVNTSEAKTFIFRDAGCC